MAASPAKLETLIGHRFANPKLLERALTHRSWAYENLPGESDDRVREMENESLEFVGDSVLGLVIAEKLFEAHPNSNEGGLTLMKHSLVSTATLARIAEELRHQYVIAFGASASNGWRPLTVKTKDRDLSVRARSGYAAGTKAGS